MIKIICSRYYSSPIWDKFSQYSIDIVLPNNIILGELGGEYHGIKNLNRRLNQITKSFDETGVNYEVIKKF